MKVIAVLNDQITGPDSLLKKENTVCMGGRGGGPQNQRLDFPNLSTDIKS